MTLGDKIKTLRESNGMTQGELAEKIGLKKSSISMYERNKNIPPTAVLSKIAHAFGMLLPDLLSYTEQDANGVIFEGVINMPAGEKVTINDMIEILGNYIALYAEKNPEDWKAAEIAASMKNNRFSLSDLGDIERFQDFKRFNFVEFLERTEIPFREHALYSAIADYIKNDCRVDTDETEENYGINEFHIYKIFEKVKGYIAFEFLNIKKELKKKKDESDKLTPEEVLEKTREVANAMKEAKEWESYTPPYGDKPAERKTIKRK